MKKYILLIVFSTLLTSLLKAQCDPLVKNMVIDSIVCDGDTSIYYFNASASSGTKLIYLWWRDFNTSIVVDTTYIPFQTYKYVPSSSWYDMWLEIQDSCGNSKSINRVLSLPNCITPGNGSSFCAPASIRFNTICNGAFITFEWDYGDGSPLDTLIMQSATHIYDVPGEYVIIATPQLKNKCPSITIYDTITILEQPIADFSIVSNMLCNNDTLKVFDASMPGPSASPVTSHYWEFGDYIGTSTSEDTQYVYSNSGIYTIKLTVTDANGCSNTHKDSVTIGTETLADFLFTSGCPCEIISFNALSGNAIQWNWDFGDGNTSIAQSPVHTYSEPGEYYVTLLATDVNGCTGKQGLTVTVCNNDIPLDTFKSSYRWYFPSSPGGNGGGVNFNTGSPPTALTDGMMTGQEGAATISNPHTGDLLFYANRDKVWNKNHVIMDNGTFLHGGILSTPGQAPMIIPNPGNINQYYVITKGFGKLAWSLVDITFNGGLGRVISKGNSLGAIASNTEELTGIEKTSATICRNAEYWLISYKNSVPSTTFEVFLIDDTGINLVNTQNIGNGNYNLWAKGAAISPDGRKYAIVGNNSMELFDFDMLTGLLSNPKTLPFNTDYVAFSPNSRFLFTAGNGNAYQIDLEANDIIGSAVLLANYFGLNGSVEVNTNNVYLGPDNKMYFQESFSGYIGAINNPNQKVSPADYLKFGVDLLGEDKAWDGLQNIIELKVPIPLDTPQIAFEIDTPVCPTLTLTMTNFSDTLARPDPCSYYWDDTIAYLWDFGDGMTSNLYNPISHTYVDSGNYDIILIITRQRDCFYFSDTLVKSVRMTLPPLLSFTADTACLGDSTSFVSLVTRIANPPISYAWSAPVLATDSNPEYIFPLDGNYSIILTVIDSLACTFADTNTVIVYPIPVANNLDTAICFGNSVILNAGIGTNFDWNLGLYLSDSTIVNPIASPSDTVSYQIIVSNGLCPSDTGLVNITVNNPPPIKTIADTIINLGESITLTTTGANTYVWTPSLFLDDNTISNPISNSLTSITYIVTGTDINGCSASDTVQISVNVKGNFFVPAAFSPNGDGDNDELLIRGLQGEKELLFRIYDRWGNKVFETNNKNEGWDGTYNNKDVKSGVFVYVIDVTLLNDMVLNKKGNVTLIR